MSKISEAVKVTKSIVDLLQEISKVLDKIYFFKKEGQSIYIKIPEKICQYDVAIRVQKSGVFSKNINFPLPRVDCIKGTCMPSLYQLENSILRTPDGFVLSGESIPKETDLILLQFQYNIPSSKFISNLVETRVAIEPEEFNDKDEYWMHAQLKFPKILQKIYSELEIQDIDLNVNVAVDNEIKTAIPKEVTKDLQIIREMLSQTERGKAHRLLLRHLQMKRRIGVDIYELIMQAQALFMPFNFRNYIEVTSPFKYFNSKQNIEFYDFPGQLVPKIMEVVSKADLTLETPAINGKVIYRKKELFEKLDDIFK